MNSRALRLNKGKDKNALTLVGLKSCDSRSEARVLTDHQRQFTSAHLLLTCMGNCNVIYTMNIYSNQVCIIVSCIQVAYLDVYLKVRYIHPQEFQQ